MMNSFKKDSVALITGGSSGIGACTALHLGKLGVKIALIYNGNQKSAEEISKQIVDNGGTCSIFKCNVADFADCKKTVDDVLKTFSKVDILVNNAGITKDKLILQMTEEDWDSVLDINLKGAFNMTKHLYSQFVKNRSGSIINVTSVSGLDGNFGQANYSSSKAGMVGLTKTVAKELASRGITCNAVAPGFIESKMTDVLSQEIKNKAIEKIPLKRMGQVEEVAKVIAFLASSNAAYITGQVLRVDGGLVL